MTNIANQFMGIIIYNCKVFEIIFTGPLSTFNVKMLSSALKNLKKKIEPNALSGTKP